MRKIAFLVLALTLLLALCSCGHLFCDFDTEWTTDETYHWHECTNEDCTEIADKATHTGGTATETKKAVCEVCGVEYGELKAHEHDFGEWTTKTPASCEEAEVEVRECACGETETRTGDAALGHSYDKEVVSDEYFVSANCEDKATYYKSCACGAAGTEIFKTGDVIEHDFGEWTTKTPASCEAAEIEKRTCANCLKEETREGDAAIAHKMETNSDNTDHWSECAYGCGKVENKAAHTAASITAAYTSENSAMQYCKVVASDLTVTAVCECDKAYTVSEGVTLENDTLVLGENTVTVKYNDLSTTVTVNAVKFNVVVDGTIKDDTYVNSGSNGNTYGSKTELPIYNTGSYRVFFRFNFSDVLASEYYAEHKDEAKVQFTFTITNGVEISDTIPFTFKSYNVTDVRSSAPFAELTWSNYNNTYTLGWGKEGDPNNTVSLLAGECLGDRVSYADGKITITVTLREIEGCIDTDGNAIFVLLTKQSAIKPKIASMENTEFDAPKVQVIFNEDHAHAYIEQNTDDDYLASENCGEKATYYYSCSCGEKGTATFEYGEEIQHVYTKAEVKVDALKSNQTCASPALYYYSCEACGAVNNAEGAETFGDGEKSDVHTTPETVDADCTTPVYCSVCEEAIVVVAKEHDFTGDWLYDEEGHWHKCLNEGCTVTDTKEGHASNSPATATENETCASCDYVMNLATGHEHNYTYSSEVTAPTCTEKGYTTYTCSCGESQTGDEVEATGHSYGSEVTAPTCTEKGYTTYTCSVCGDNYTGDEVDAAGHSYDAVVTDPTCTKAGYTTYTCSVCGDNYTGDEVEATGHSYSEEWSSDAEKHWKECTACGEKTDEADHTGNATIATAANCTVCDKEYIKAILIDDTYVGSSNKTNDFSSVEELRVTKNDNRRAYLRLDFSDIITGKVAAPEQIKITFTVTSGTIADDTTYTMKAFDLTDSDTINVDFGKVAWNYIGSSGDYSQLAWNSTDNPCSIDVTGKITSSVNTDENEVKTIILTLNYSDIADYIDTDTGYLILGFTTNSSNARIASMENTDTAKRPNVELIFTEE